MYMAEDYGSLGAMRAAMWPGDHFELQTEQLPQPNVSGRLALAGSGNAHYVRGTQAPTITRGWHA